MQHKFKKLSVLTVLVVFLFSFAPDIVESRRRGGRSFSRSRSYSRSTTRRSYTPSRSSTRSYNRSSTSRSATSPRTSTSRTTRSTGSSYSRSSTSRSTGPRTSTVARQRQTATNRARVTPSSTSNRNTTATRNATRSQQRQVKAQNRKQVRQLKAENRSLKRQNRRANRDTARARRQQRQVITVNNFGGYYPMMGYTTYSLAASMAFNNLLFGIYFHDYYNHAIRHSYLWHYHHRNYDRSHWSAEKQAEYERYKAYYESQGIEPNPNYVDPDTNADENYTASYVEENPDKFYAENAEFFTVEELPDEEALKAELLAAAEDTPTMTASDSTTTSARAPPETRTVVIEKKTSGATWFLLIFGGIIVVGVVMLVMYNKGYF